MITARLVGKVFFVVGFMLALYGLGQGDRRLVDTALALIVTGIIATAVGVYQHVQRRRTGRD